MQSLEASLDWIDANQVVLILLLNHVSPTNELTDELTGIKSTLVNFGWQVYEF